MRLPVWIIAIAAGGCVYDLNSNRENFYPCEDESHCKDGFVCSSEGFCVRSGSGSGGGDECAGDCSGGGDERAGDCGDGDECAGDCDGCTSASDCDDGNECTIDSCDSSSVCTYDTQTKNGDDCTVVSSNDGTCVVVGADIVCQMKSPPWVAIGSALGRGESSGYRVHVVVGAPSEVTGASSSYRVKARLSTRP